MKKSRWELVRRKEKVQTLLSLDQLLKKSPSQYVQIIKINLRPNREKKNKNRIKIQRILPITFIGKVLNLS
jgi:hypothetical protein